MTLSITIKVKKWKRRGLHPKVGVLHPQLMTDDSLDGEEVPDHSVPATPKSKCHKLVI